MIKNSLKILFALIIFAEITFSQQVAVKPFDISRTDLISDLKTLRKNSPAMKADELTQKANALLEKQGLNFDIAFDAATCGKLLSIKNSRKDVNAPLNLHSSLTSSTGEKAGLTLPEPVFNPDNCVPCQISLPLLEITDQDFVTIVQNINIKFLRPQNFMFGEIGLVDNKDFKTVKQRWRIPFATTPLNVSSDGKILYLELKDTELNDIALMIYNEGTFQFTPKSSIDMTEKSVPADLPKDADSVNYNWLKFGTGENAKILRYAKNCH